MAVIREVIHLLVSDSVITSYHFIIIGVFVLFLGRVSPPPPVGQGLLIHNIYRSQTTTSDQLVAEKLLV